MTALPQTTQDQPPYLGAILRVDEGLAQLIHAEHILAGTREPALSGTQTEQP